jgi:hypothetical protein
VVVCGDSVIDAAVPPCDHTNVPPATFDVAVKVPLVPSHITIFGTVIIGNGVTVTVLAVSYVVVA